MKHFLIIKTSSLGDVIHTLPAITDAVKADPELRFSWVVEEGFKEIPSWHPAVEEVIPVAIRRWRKNWWQSFRSGEWKKFRNKIKSEKYDGVIDAQGLIKSALVTRTAKGTRHGFDKNSAREGIASYTYHRKYSVERNQHAITRLRTLFAKIFDYPQPTGLPDYGIELNKPELDLPDRPYLVFLHGTTWETKHWPENYWRELAETASQNGYHVLLPWGNDAEKERATYIAKDLAHVEILPKLNLLALTKVLGSAHGVVAVDTGLSHLAAALNTPCISLYGSTNPGLTGTFGQNTKHLATNFTCSPCLERQCPLKAKYNETVDPPCFSALPPQHVWGNLLVQMGSNS